MRNENSRNYRSRNQRRIIIPGLDLPQRRLRELRRRALRGVSLMCDKSSSGWTIQLNAPDFTFEGLECRVFDLNDPSVSCFKKPMLYLESSSHFNSWLSNLEFYGFELGEATLGDNQEFRALDWIWRHEIREATGLMVMSKPLHPNRYHRQVQHVTIPGVVLPRSRQLELRRRVRRGAQWLRNNRTWREWTEEVLAPNFQFDLMKLPSGKGPLMLCQIYWDLDSLDQIDPYVSNPIFHGLEIESSVTDLGMEYMALDALWTGEAKKVANQIR